MIGPRWTRGVGFRIGAAAVATTALGVGIVAVGVLLIGGDTFARLMVEHGSSAATAHAMFDESVTVVLVAAVAVACAVAVGLATYLGRRLARPLGDVGEAARRIADGDYGTRVPGHGPEEIVRLADSFNQMAISLEEGERLRREFIANAAHELRTPLTNLKGYLEGLRDGVIPSDVGTFVSLSEEVERLVRLAESLDALAEDEARAAPARVVDVDVASAIRTAADLAGPGVERAGLALDVELPRELIARADPDGLAQVLSNLFQNAIRYTSSGGRVTVRAERRPREVLVSVANTGDPIPAADLPHVFERFYRVDKSRDRAHGGAGIGLAIVQQRVEAVGGRVGVESGGEGTRFWFSLPI